MHSCLVGGREVSGAHFAHQTVVLSRQDAGRKSEPQDWPSPEGLRGAARWQDGRALHGAGLADDNSVRVSGRQAHLPLPLCVLVRICAAAAVAAAAAAWTTTPLLRSALDSTQQLAQISPIRLNVVVGMEIFVYTLENGTRSLYRSLVSS